MAMFELQKGQNGDSWYVGVNERAEGRGNQQRGSGKVNNRTERDKGMINAL
jgi:hypothetical protein